MREYRAIKNRKRIGKPWHCVFGECVPHNTTREPDGTRWETITVVSEHDSQEAALHAVAHWTNKRMFGS